MSSDATRHSEVVAQRTTYERVGLVGDQKLTWEVGTGDRRLHDRIVASMPQSPFIVGGSPADDAIRIRTSPADKRRFRGEIIRFDSVIAPGGMRLNDAGMEHHLVTAKILVNMGLLPGIGWCSSDLSMKSFSRSFLLLLRWMRVNGIPRMGALQDVHYHRFEEQLLEGGLQRLYPILPTLEAFLAEVVDGRAALPTYRDGGRIRLSMDLVAHRLGLAKGRELGDEARGRILDVAKSVCPEVVRHFPPAERRLGIRDDAGEGLTSSRIIEILEPWERLHDLRTYLNHDAIGYRAFTPLRSRMQVASALGRETGRTRDIPHNVLGFLLDRALRWLDYAEHIKSVYEAIRSVRNTPGFRDKPPATRRAAVRATMAKELIRAPVGPGAPSPMLPEYSTFWGDVRGIREQGLDLRTVLTRLLPGACFVLIATFSARRKKEMESLSSGCIVRDDDPWLLAWIGKNMRDVDRVPVPECVARAVAILEWLSEDGRRVTGEPWLFSFQELARGGNVIEIKLDQALNAFAQFVGMDDFHKGPALLLAAHQFRRAFAILHFYRFRMPSLPALSYFLRHYDSIKTWRYVSDVLAGKYLKIIEERNASDELIQAAKRGKAEAAANAKALEEVAEDFMVDVLVKAERGEEPVVGKGGEALMLELKHFTAAISNRIVVTTAEDGGSAPTLDVIIRQFVKGTRMRIAHNPSGTSSCLCGSDPQRLSVANCLCRKAEREGTQSVVGAKEPDFGYAEPVECVDCYNGVQLPEHEKWMAEYIEGQREMASTGAAPMLRNAAWRRVDKMERFREKYYELPDQRSVEGRHDG